MISPAEVLAATAWADLEHAYGDAADLPERLLDLVSEDPDKAGRALSDLDMGVLHQGTIYSSTAPTTLFVAGILTDQRTSLVCESAFAWDDRSRRLRASLLEWLAAVADSADYDYEASEEDEHRALEAVRALRPTLYRAIIPFVDDQDDATQAAALLAAANLLRDPALVDDRAALIDHLLESAPRASAAHRARTALALDTWDVAPTALLHDHDPAVRAYAAVASTLDDDPAALAEVRAALADPAAVDACFADAHFPQLAETFIREHLVDALLRRTTTVEEVEAETIAVASAMHPLAGRIGLTALMARAFAESSEVSPAQRRIRAHLDNLP